MSQPLGGLDATQVRVGTTGSVLVGALNLPAPEDALAALTGAWADLGYLTEDGITLSKSVDSTDINAWQSGVPVRTIITGQTLTLNFPMQQTNSITIGVYFGIEIGSDGVAHIPSDPAPFERSLVMNWVDGDYRSRFYVPRAQLSDTGDIQVHRGDPVVFNVTFTALAPQGGGDLAVWFRDPVNGGNGGTRRGNNVSTEKASANA